MSEWTMDGIVGSAKTTQNIVIQNETAANSDFMIEIRGTVRNQLAIRNYCINLTMVIRLRFCN